MDHTLYIHVIVTGLATTLALIAVWAPRKLWVKISAIVVAGFFMPLAYAAVSDLLSRPKPVSLEWPRKSASEAAVLGANLKEGEAIYVWLQLPGLEEPRAYRLPWNEAMARQLYQTQQMADATGASVLMRQPFRHDVDETEQRFYPEPQPPAPPKRTSNSGPLIFSHPSRSQ